MLKKVLRLCMLTWFVNGKRLIKVVVLIDKPRVLVMLAAYNGSRYICEQIESILVQQDVNVTLLITDDCSTDDTPEICAEYARRFDNVVFHENAENKGSTATFFSMIENADPGLYDYFALSDQDDLWFPEKLSIAVSALENDQDHAWLYYSDVTNCNEDLSSLIGSGKDFNKFEKDAYNLKALLCVNWGSGNTMVFNRELLGLLRDTLPEDCPRNHDAWIHLVALSCGTTYPDLQNSYLARRISGSNQVGTRNFGKLSPARIADSIQAALAPSEKLWIDTAYALYDCHKNDMTPESRLIVEEFLATETDLLTRVKTVLDPQYHLPNLLDTFTMKIRFLLNKN